VDASRTEFQQVTQKVKNEKKHSDKPRGNQGSQQISRNQFLLGMVLAIYVGFARLNHIRFVAQDPMLARILKVSRLPRQSTFWRFLASLNLNLAGQLCNCSASCANVRAHALWPADGGPQGLQPEK
jgi:hypothetical protein